MIADERAVAGPGRYPGGAPPRQNMAPLSGFDLCRAGGRVDQLMIGVGVPVIENVAAGVAEGEADPDPDPDRSVEAMCAENGLGVFLVKTMHGRFPSIYGRQALAGLVHLWLSPRSIHEDEMTYTPHNQRIVDQFIRWAQPFADLPAHPEADAMARTLAACALDPDVSVLDVACGSGILACAMAERVRRVTGIDLTPAIIAQARKRQYAQGAANMAWQVGDATVLPCSDAVFDRVTTRYSFDHMPDPARVLAEMKRVCRPNGRIVVIDATPSPATRDAYDAMERLRDPSHTSALTLDELCRIGREAGLEEAMIDGYRLEAQLDTLADSQDMPALTALFEADIASGQDRLGVGAGHGPTGIRFHFPVSIIAWHCTTAQGR
ncbi:class I SAM-dependent methyltransferase [Gluconacetobacter sacchari]|nr:methyltransferase domain-containing protein [Gluconacetobacter sacchari]